MTNAIKDALCSTVAKIRQQLCCHRFLMRDLIMHNRDSDGDDRVRWSCCKCGRVFNAHCGLDISPQHGPIVGR